MMKPQRISIALCTCNGEKYLREQLDSIEFQTRLPDELVVCDDASSDHTVEIIEAFASTVLFPVHLTINKKNLGSTKNFEKAIGLCRGDIIVLSDQDDVWYPEKLRRLEAVFSGSSQIGAVFTDAQVVDEQLNPLGYSLWQSVGFGGREQRRLADGKAFDVLLRRNVVTGCTMAFRSEFKDMVLPIPEKHVHDAWIAIIISAIAKVVALPEPLIKYRQHARNQIGAANPGIRRQLNTTFKLCDRSVYLREADFYNEVKQRLRRAGETSVSSDLTVKL
ncbi:MAG TPA: glycosyltransferase family 2 protein, partial [Acetivibrio sp.]|nr:glycosyltransferase family 2 protein [Acetivibrio sp.]